MQARHFENAEKQWVMRRLLFVHDVPNIQLESLLAGCLLHMSYNAGQIMLGRVMRDRGPAWVKF